MNTRESMASRSFSRFTVKERLGAGGMGVVYRAVDEKLGRNVALKVLSSVDAMRGEARERFLCEARAASALDHPNIGAIYGIEEGEGGDLCIVMAYYDAETIADRLARGRISVAETLRIVIEVADGLSHAHAHGIIHRDIKPSNILLTRTGGTKIVDFGLATCTACGENPLTEPSTVVGTAAYMSPEQAQGLPVDGRSDVWSLGAVLYEMLSGQRPFSGNSTFSLLYSVVHADPHPLNLGFVELERAVLKALEKNPANRYQSMDEFGRELRRIASELEAQSSDPTIIVAVPARRRRLPRGRGIAGIAVAALAVAAGVLALPAARERVGRMAPITIFQSKPVALAILPFSADADADTGALARGFSQALSARIAGLERFENSVVVIPAGDLASRNISSPEEAHKLAGATLVIGGELRKSSTGALGLQIELWDSRGARPLKWTANDDGGDLGALEYRAAAHVFSALDLRVAGQVLAATPRSGARKQAYEAYLRGLGNLQRWDKLENLDRAISAFAEATRSDESFALAYAGLAEASRTRFRVTKDLASIQHALNYANQALRLDSGLAEAHVVHGRVLQDMGRRDEAVVEFRKSLDADPRNSGALLGMGRAYEDLNNAVEAENAYRRAIELNPYSWAARNNLASFYIRRGRLYDAEAQFRRAVLLTPDNPAVLSNLGVVLMRQKRMDEASKTLRRSIELGPSYAAYVNLGNIHYRMRRFQQAADAYDKALQLNSKDFRIWGTKAQALRLSKQSSAEAAAAYRSAINLAEQQLRVNEADPRTHSLLGIYYACVGDHASATRVLAQALAQGTSDKDVLIDVATAYELLGDRGAAAVWAQRALTQGYPWDEFNSDPDLESLIRTGAVRAVRN